MKKSVLVNLSYILIILFLVGIVCAIVGDGKPAPHSEVTQEVIDDSNQEALIFWMKNVETLKQEGKNIISGENSLWKSFVESDKQNQAWNKLTTEEKRSFLKTIVGESEYEMSLNEVKGIDSELTWEGSKLKTKTGAYLDFENISPWITEIDYSDDKLKLRLDTQLSGNKENERTIVFEGKGTINEDGILELEGVSNKNGGSFGINTPPKISLVHGEGGTLTIRENNEISILGGANLKINNDFYEQFYSKDSKWYKPEDGGDEEAVVKITQIQKTTPSDSIYLPEAQNTIVSIPNEDGETLGEFYTSRRKGVKIINTKESYFDPFGPNYDPEYDPPYKFPFDPSTDPFIEINSDGENKMDVKIIGDYYVGFIPEEGTESYTFVYGKGDLIKVKGQKELRGQYHYIKNGDFKTSFRKGETHVAGNSEKATTPGEIRNGFDPNPDNKLIVTVNKGSSTVSTPDGRININRGTNENWNPSPKLAEVMGTLDKTKEAIVKNNPQVIEKMEKLEEIGTPTSIAGTGISSSDEEYEQEFIGYTSVLKYYGLTN